MKVTKIVDGKLERLVNIIEHLRLSGQRAQNMFNELDGRKGRDNELTAYFLEEYQQKVYESPRDEAEDRRVDILRTSF